MKKIILFFLLVSVSIGAYAQNEAANDFIQGTVLAR
jgi:hypothetical protein